MKHLKITSVIVFVFVVIVHLLFILKFATKERVVTPKKETVQKINLRNVTLVSKPKVQPKPKKKLKPKPKPKSKKKPKPKKKIKAKPKPKKIIKPKRVIKKPKVVPKPEVKPKKEQKVKPQKEIQKPKEVKPTKPVKAEPKLSASKAQIIKSRYIREIKNEIEKRKYYPRRAKRLHHEGTVSVRFTILADGSIKDVTLAEPSRYKRLNSGTLKTLKMVGKFPPIPKKLQMQQWEIVVPIEYILK